MFNPHIHQQQQQQQQQQFQQHLRQLQHLFQQQPPPPPPPPPPAHHVSHHHHHHRQAQRPMPLPSRNPAPPPRMVNLCQATQTTIIAPNPMLQGALMMQQMQGGMRGYAMGGQQFRQFFAGARSSLLGPVPMGMAIKSPMMGYPAPRHYHQHGRYYNNNNNHHHHSSSSSSSSNPPACNTDVAARQPDRKRDGEQRGGEDGVNGQPAPGAGSHTSDTAPADGAVGDLSERHSQPTEDATEGPALKKQRTEGVEEPTVQPVTADEDHHDEDDDDAVLMSEYNEDTAVGDPDDCILLEEGGSTVGSDAVEALEESRVAEVPSDEGVRDGPPVSSPLEEIPEDGEAPQQVDEEDPQDQTKEGPNKFYCYLCSITCHNQQNFRSHMNGMSHQQRMMEIQHMSNACLVTLLPRVQETLQGAQRDGEKRAGQQRWCATCHTHFSSSIMDHRRTREHKLVCRAVSPSCTVCKKHFRSTQLFVEHMQSQTHKQRVEECQGPEGLEVLVAMDPDGCPVDEQEDDCSDHGDESHGNEDAEGSSGEQEGWSGRTEVSLKDMDTDEEYEPDTIYGSSFLAPVAGFLCRLCNRFYHFESTALHSHCRSLVHFENLKKYRALQRDTAAAAPPSGGALVSSHDQSMQPVITVTRLKEAPGGGHSQEVEVEVEEEEEEEEEGTTAAAAVEAEALATSTEEGDGCCALPDPLVASFQACVDQGDPPVDQEDLHGLTDGKQEGSECQPGRKEVEEEKGEKMEEGASGPGRKAKAAPRRRSGRAACRH